MNSEQPQFDQKRFIVAMLLSGVILVGWQMFFAPEPPPPPKKGEEVTQTAAKTKEKEVEKKEPLPEEIAEKADADDVGGPVVDTTADAKPIVREQPEVREDVLETEKFRVTVTNNGGRTKAVEILEPEQYGARGDLLSDFPDDSEYFPYRVRFSKDSIALPKDLVYAVDLDKSVASEKGFQKIVYRYDDPQGRFTLEKNYSILEKGPYQLKLDVRLINRMEQGRLADHFALDIFGYKDPEKETSFLDMMPDEVEGLCKLEGDMEREAIGSVENPMSFSEAPTVWGGIDTRYFLFSAVPNEPGIECTFDPVDTNYLRTRITQEDFSIAPGETATVGYELFIGPKDYGILEEAGHKLEESVDYGILTFLSRPLRWGLVELYGFVGNWGLAIILLTLIIRGLTWPINAKVYENGERMKQIQPELEKLKEKFKNDQQRQAEATMKLFKENNVSPMGCLPMFLQFPILLALYYMILNSVELYHAEFALWYTDLSAPDPYFVLPVLMGVVMFVQQSFMMPETSANPQMKTIMKIMPITFTAFMLFLPSGVVLYYSVSLVLGLVQQFYIKKKYRTAEA